MNRPGSDATGRSAAIGTRTRLWRIAFALYLAFAPSTVPDWRTAPTLPPARVLPIGEPTPALWNRRRGTIGR